MYPRSPFYRIAAVSAALYCSGLIGCSDRAGTTEPPSGQSPLGINLQILDYAGIQKLIDSHLGQVIVLDCWSTSCPPCIEEFPKLVALHKKYDPSQLACISLSFDFEGSGKPDDVQPEVLKFLKTQVAAFENVLGSEPSDALLKKMNLASIPAVFVYDRQGNIHRFEGSKAYENVPALVEQLLAAPQPSKQ